jgi:O-antigen/teichoic acid export membrane protein
MGLRAKYARTAVLSTVLTNLGFIMNLLYGKVLAVLIPIAQMDIIGILNTLTTLILGASSFGILYTITQKAPSIGKGDPNKARHIIWRGSLTYYVVSIPFSFILLFFSLWSQNLLIFLIPMVLFIMLSMLRRSQRIAMDGMLETEKGVLFTGLYSWAQWGCSLGILLLFLHWNISDFYVGIIYGWVTSNIFFAIIGIALVQKYFRGAKASLGLPIITYLSFGLPVFGAYVIQLLGQQIDKLFLMALNALGVIPIGVFANYFFAARISSSLNEFAMSFTRGLVALLALLFGMNLQRMQNAHSAVIRFILLISTPLYLAVAAFGEVFIVLLIDPTKYAGIQIFLPFLTFAYFFELVITVLLLGRQASGQRRLIPVIWGVLILLKLGLLIPFGQDLLTISIIVLIANFLLAIVVSIYLRKELQLGYFWVKLSIPIIIMLIAGFFGILIVFLDPLIDILFSLGLCFLFLFFAIFISLRLRLLTLRDMGIIRSVMPKKLHWIVNLLARIGGYPLEEQTGALEKST